MSYGFELRSGIPSTYGKAIAETPRIQPKKSNPTDKPVLKNKNNAQNH